MSISNTIFADRLDDILPLDPADAVAHDDKEDQKDKDNRQDDIADRQNIGVSTTVIEYLPETNRSSNS